MAIRLPAHNRAKAQSAQRAKPQSAGRPSASAVGQINARLKTLGQQYLSLTSAGDFVAALAVNAQAKALAPNHPQIVGDAALCHLRLGDYALARDLYTQACALAPNETNLRDGLTEACGHLGLMD